MMSRAGKTDSTDLSVECVTLRPELRSVMRSDGKPGYLSYGNFTARPSHPASTVDLFSLVPRRRSTMLRRSRTPLLRIGHLRSGELELWRLE
jgi:hypothetical protein